MNSSGPIYTGAQLAIALRLSKRAVLKILETVSPDGVAIVRGNRAAAWSVSALPERLRASLARAATANGQSLADFLETCARPWQPKLALSEIAAASLDAARKLRDALRPALERRDAPALTNEDRVRLGLEDYQRAFGHPITERHWRRLIERTERRDRGAEDFERLELYLPKHPARKTAARLLPHECDFKELRATMEAFANSQAPTHAEKAALWAEAFGLLESRAHARRERKALRRQLANFLARHAPWLAANEHALRVSFDRKFARWQSAGRTPAALLDGREEKRGLPTAMPFKPDDLDRIIWHTAANCGGRVAQGARELLEAGGRSGLSAEMVDYLARPRSRKRSLPRRLSDIVTPEVRMLQPYRLGKQAIDDATAHLDRDYSKLASMQVICADDFTMPVYFYAPDGLGWFTLTRGQVLLMMDVRSWKIIAWSLQPERNYNSLVIRTLMNRVCAGWGIPGNWYFERGIWKNAKLVKGETPTGWEDALSWPAVQVGWEKLGVHFIHATRARSKPVERVGGLLQDLMEGTRGYCGRDERRDCPEVTMRAKDDVEARRVGHPSELFLSFDEWETELGNLIDRYNASGQEGDTLRGQSPNEAFEACWPHGNPPDRFGATCWHLVAHYVKPLPVTVNGITFRIGAQKYVYRDGLTGQDRGKMVLGWFDPECPEVLCVTDLDRRNPYLVERARPVDFLAAPGDPVFEREIAKAQAHSAYPKARFHVLKARFAPTFRRAIPDAFTAETGATMRELRDTHSAAQRQQTAHASKAREAYGRLRMPLPARERQNPEAARRLSQMLSEDDATPAAELPEKSL